MPAANRIVLSAEPRGRFIGGIVSGTPKPGTILQIQAGTPPQGNRLTWEAYNQSGDGVTAQLAILCENSLIGGTKDDAVVSGTWVQLYLFEPGDELNLLCANLTGTGSGTDDVFDEGDQLMVDDGTGKGVKATGSVVRPFTVVEAHTQLLGADDHVKVIVNGY